MSTDTLKQTVDQLMRPAKAPQAKSCDGVPEDASAQDHLDRGRKLVATNQYPEAMRCLLRAMERGKGTSVYRESCQAVSMLYDNGWGVQKNVETARLWRVKSNE